MTATKRDKEDGAQTARLTFHLVFFDFLLKPRFSLSLLSQHLRGVLPDCDDLSKVKLVVVHLGDENGCHGLV